MQKLAGESNEGEKPRKAQNTKTANAHGVADGEIGGGGWRKENAAAAAAQKVATYENSVNKHGISWRSGRRGGGACQ